MTWGPQEVQKAIFLLLDGDSALQTLLGGNGRVRDFVQGDTSYPYLTIYALPFTDRGNHTGEGMAAEFQITTWVRGDARGNKSTLAIQERVDQLLHLTELTTMSGWGTTLLRRSYVDIKTMDDNVTKQGIQRFKLQIGDQ